MNMKQTEKTEKTEKPKTAPAKKTVRAAKNKKLSATLYSYVQPANDKWVRAQAFKKKVAYSEIVDGLITSARARFSARKQANEKTSPKKAA